MGERGREVPGGLEGGRPGGQPHRVRSVRRAREGRRGSDPHLRDELDEAHPASVEDPERGPGDRVHGAQGRQGQRAHFARPEAGGAGSLADLGRALSGQLDRRGQGAQPDQLRRLRGTRGRHRRVGAHFRHELDAPHRPPQRTSEEGRYGQGAGALTGQAEPPGQLGPQAGAGGSVAVLDRALQDRQHGDGLDLEGDRPGRGGHAGRRGRGLHSRRSARCR